MSKVCQLLVSNQPPNQGKCGWSEDMKYASEESKTAYLASRLPVESPKKLDEHEVGIYEEAYERRMTADEILTTIRLWMLGMIPNGQLKNGILWNNGPLICRIFEKRFEAGKCVPVANASVSMAEVSSANPSPLATASLAELVEDYEEEDSNVTKDEFRDKLTFLNPAPSIKFCYRPATDSLDLNVFSAKPEHVRRITGHF